MNIAGQMLLAEQRVALEAFFLILNNERYCAGELFIPLFLMEVSFMDLRI